MGTGLGPLVRYMSHLSTTGTSNSPTLRTPRVPPHPNPWGRPKQG